MMTRLTGLDGVTLHGETSVMPTHVLAVMFCDPATRGELSGRAVLRLSAERTVATRGFVRIAALKTTAIVLTPQELRISLGAEPIPVPEPFPGHV
jgi:hypothetical protein